MHYPRIVMLCVLSAAVCCAPLTARADLEKMVGDWRSVSANDSMAKLKIVETTAGVCRVTVTGRQPMPHNCFSKQPGFYYVSGKAAFTEKNFTKILVDYEDPIQLRIIEIYVQSTAPLRLLVKDYHTIKTGTNKGSHYSTHLMEPDPYLCTIHEHFSPMNCAAATVRHVGNQYVIVAGPSVEYSYTNPTTANQALAILKALDPTRCGWVGTAEHPEFKYPLKGSSAITERRREVQQRSFQPQHLKVVHQGSKWNVVYQSFVVCSLANETDAVIAMRILKKYNVNTLCWYGTASDTNRLEYFRR